MPIMLATNSTNKIIVLNDVLMLMKEEKTLITHTHTHTHTNKQT